MTKKAKKGGLLKRIQLLVVKARVVNSQTGTFLNDHEIWHSDYTKKEIWDLLCANLDIKVVRSKH